MVSDNAANFKFVQPLVGIEVKTSNIKLNTYLSNNVVKWKFIPQYVPWHGGVYERLVTIVKSCLKKCFSINFLTYDEYQTAQAKIKKTINDRPLTYSDEDVSLPLTPNHFLFPSRRTNINESLEVDENKINSHRETLIFSYRITHSVLEYFWLRFQKEYLFALREKQRKTPYKKNSLPYLPRKGEVVLRKEPTDPRAHWSLGVVIRLEPGGRTAYVRSRNTTTVKAVNQLYPLEIPDETKTDHNKSKLSAKKEHQKRQYLNKSSPISTKKVRLS